MKSQFWLAVPFFLVSMSSCQKEECCDCPQSGQGSTGLQLDAFTFCENGPATNNDTLQYDYEWESFASVFGVADWDEFVDLIEDDCDCHKE